MYCAFQTPKHLFEFFIPVYEHPNTSSNPKPEIINDSGAEPWFLVH